MGVKISKNLHFFTFFYIFLQKFAKINKNEHVLNTFFALLDFGRNSHELTRMGTNVRTG